MRRWPIAVALAVIQIFALPAIADATKRKTAKVRASASGDVTVAGFEVTVRAARGGRASAPQARVTNARRLRGNKVITSIARIRGNRFQVTLVVLNPRRAGSAQASQGVIADIGIRARGDLTVAQAYAARDVINSHGLAAGLGASRFCTDKRRRAALEGQLQAVGFTRVQARGVIGDLVALLCQRGRLARIGAARRRLENRGVAAPSCSGTVARFGAGRSEVRAAISCSEATRAVVLRAQAGNPGVNCLPPQGAACDFGPSCRGQQEDVCFGSNPSFPPLTLIEGNAAWRDEVPNPGGVLDVSGSSFSPNPDAPASGIYLFRYTGPGAAPR